MYVEKLGRGFAWLDTGTPASLLQASSFVQTIQERQGLKVACPEEIGMTLGYLTADEVCEAGLQMKSDYGKYLVEIANEARSEWGIKRGIQKTERSSDGREWATGQGDLPNAGGHRRTAA